MKSQNKKVLLISVFLITIVFVILICQNQKSDGEKSSNAIINDIIENKTVEDKVIENKKNEIISNSLPDEDTPDETLYLSLSNEDKVKCSSCLGTFDDGKNLTTEQYLSVVYNALNSGYINANKTKYTEKEINDIVYTIFNVKLNENKSVDGLKYNNGTYTIEKSQKKDIKFGEMENGTAAGSVYITYEMDNKRYIARLTTNTVNSEVYISSIIEE